MHAPLRGLPLLFIDLSGSENSNSDFSPLAGCPTLEEIILPPKPGDLSALRQLPRLKLISTRNANGHPTQTAAEFWKEYDAKQAAGKK